jgi:hypothetical protein
MTTYNVYDAGIEGEQVWNIEVDGLLTEEYCTVPKVWEWMIKNFKPGDELFWEEEGNGTETK